MTNKQKHEIQLRCDFLSGSQALILIKDKILKCKITQVGQASPFNLVFFIVYEYKTNANYK